MSTENRLLSIICEAVLESFLEQELPNLGATGYTITDARGSGHHGRRSGAWSRDGNIRVDVLCTSETLDNIVEHLRAHYAKDYALKVFAVQAESFEMLGM